MTIYLIEDDIVYAEFIRKSLTKDGTNSITWFSTAEDCLVAIQKGIMPEAFIIDYKLPGMAGIDLYEKLKPILTTEKIIIMSSIDDGNLVLSFIQAGVRDYVIKDEHVIESLVAILEGKEDDFYLFN